MRGFSSLFCDNGPEKGDTTKPGLWTMDWTVDWTMDWAFLYELSCSTSICFSTWLDR